MQTLVANRNSDQSLDQTISSNLDSTIDAELPHSDLKSIRQDLARENQSEIEKAKTLELETQNDPRSELFTNFRNAITETLDKNDPNTKLALDKADSYFTNFEQLQSLAREYQEKNDDITANKITTRADEHYQLANQELLTLSAKTVSESLTEKGADLSDKIKSIETEIADLKKLDQYNNQILAGALDVKLEELAYYQNSYKELSQLNKQVSEKLELSTALRAEQNNLTSEQGLAFFSNVNANNITLSEITQAFDSNIYDQRMEQVEKYFTQKQLQTAQTKQNLDNAELVQNDFRDIMDERGAEILSGIGSYQKEINEIESQPLILRNAGILLGTESAQRESAEASFAHTLGLQKTQDVLVSRYATSKKELNNYIDLQAQARKHEQQGDLAQAQKKYEEAFKSLQNSFSAVDLNSAKQSRAVVDRQYQSDIPELQKSLSVAIQNTEVAERRLEIALTTTVVVGATVATGGVATGALMPSLTAGMGVWATGATAAAIGTGTGMGISAASNGAFLASNESLGGDRERALEQAKGRFVDHSYQSAKAAAGTALGVGVTKHGLTLLGRGQEAISLGQRAIASSMGGFSSSSLNAGFNSAEFVIARQEAIKNFDQSYNGPESQKDLAREKFLADNKLDYGTLAKQNAIQIVVGTGSAGLGTYTGRVTEIQNTVGKKFIGEAAEVGADFVVGLGASYLSDGDLSNDQIFNQIVQSSFSSAQSLSRISGTKNQVLDNSKIAGKPGYLSGEIEVNGKAGNITVSEDGSAIYVRDKELLQELYRESLAEQEGLALANVGGFYDPKRSQIVILDGTTQDNSILEATLTTMRAIHERVHQKKGTGRDAEISAWREQEAFLNGAGFQLESIEGKVVIRELDSAQVAIKLSDTALNDFISKEYGATVEQSVAAMSEQELVVSKQELIDTDILDTIEKFNKSPKNFSQESLVYLYSKMRSEGLAIADIENIKARTTLINGIGENIAKLDLNPDQLLQLKSEIQELYKGMDRKEVAKTISGIDDQIKNIEDHKNALAISMAKEEAVKQADIKAQQDAINSHAKRLTEAEKIYPTINDIDLPTYLNQITMSKSAQSELLRIMIDADAQVPLYKSEALSFINQLHDLSQRSHVKGVDSLINSAYESKWSKIESRRGSIEGFFTEAKVATIIADEIALGVNIPAGSQMELAVRGLEHNGKKIYVSKFTDKPWIEREVDILITLPTGRNVVVETKRAAKTFVGKNDGNIQSTQLYSQLQIAGALGSDTRFLVVIDQSEQEITASNANKLVERAIDALADSKKDHDRKYSKSIEDKTTYIRVVSANSIFTPKKESDSETSVPQDLHAQNTSNP